VLTVNDKSSPSAATSGNDQPTGVTITATPTNDGWVGVYVNVSGPFELGDADKTKDCYFSPDGGTTVRSIGSIVAGDELIWNGSIAGFDLDTSDEISLIYSLE
jgi:hypothetical protein